MTLLDVRALRVEFRTGQGPLRAVDGVDLAVPAGSITGLVGESGCGKSTLGRALMGVLPSAARIAGGEILFEGQDLLQLSGRAWRKLRWRRMSFIPQTAMNALDPVAVWVARQQHRVRRRCSTSSASTPAGYPTTRISSAAACGSAPPSHSLWRWNQASLSPTNL